MNRYLKSYWIRGLVVLASLVALGCEPPQEIKTISQPEQPSTIQDGWDKDTKIIIFNDRCFWGPECSERNNLREFEAFSRGEVDIKKVDFVYISGRVNSIVVLYKLKVGAK